MIEDKGQVFGINDIDRLDFLQERSVGCGFGWIFRSGAAGRGIGLHVTSRSGASATVRGAIDKAIRAQAKASHDEARED